MRSNLTVAMAFVALIVPLAARAGDAPSDGAQALRARYAATQAETASPFGLPLVLASSQRDGVLQGDIDARLDHPFATLREALGDPEHWCEIMILHPNVKNCRAGEAAGGGAGTLLVHVGRSQNAVRFVFRVAQAREDYVDVRLEAPSGPAGTTDYRIRVEAAPVTPERTVLHLAYSHGFGTRAKLAMDAYFATFGRDKVGFTVVGRDAQGAPQHVGDLRGGLERNAMRYYLAIRSYVEAGAAPPAQRRENALRRFVGYTERWPLQLREEPGFVETKRQDFARMGTAR